MNYPLDTKPLNMIVWHTFLARLSFSYPRREHMLDRVQWTTGSCTPWRGCPYTNEHVQDLSYCNEILLWW